MLSFKVFNLPHKQPFLVNLNKMISPVITKLSKGVETMDLNSVLYCCVLEDFYRSVYFHFTLQETVINTERQTKVSNLWTFNLKHFSAYGYSIGFAEREKTY